MWPLCFYWGAIKTNGFAVLLYGDIKNMWCCCVAGCNKCGQVEEDPEVQVEDKVEDKVEDMVEDMVEDKVEDKVGTH